METNWFKSSYSTAANNCVEAAFTPEGINIRDTKDNGQGPVFSFTAAAWQSFLAELPQLTS